MTHGTLFSPCGRKGSRRTWRKHDWAAQRRGRTDNPRAWLWRLVKRCADASKKIFGWIKTVGGLRRTRYRGLERVDFAGYLVAAAYNLVRLARLATAAAIV
jgi:IS5 family transposase